MAQHLWKFKSGIYPVIPGQTMELGDYGYWKDSQWCRIGNIQEIPGMPIVLSDATRPLDQFVNEQFNVKIQGSATAEADVQEAKIESSLLFEEKHSQFFYGRLNQCKYYCSIEQEILPYLLKLHNAGIWKKNFWLAYYIAESDRFFTLRSEDSGAEIRLKMHLSESLLNESADLESIFSSSLSSVEKVSSLGNGLKFAGAKFISLEKKHWLAKEKVIKFNYGVDDDIFP